MNQAIPSIQNRYFALRHGESLANQQGIILSEPRVGCREFGLSDAGKAALLQNVVAYRCELGANLAIFSSDFRRARETAEILGESTQCEVELSPLLRERYFGDWEATPNLNYQRVWEEDCKDEHHTRWNVESVSSVVERMLALIQRIEGQHSETTIVLVSHGDPLQMLQCVLEGKPPGLHRELPSLGPGELRLLAPLRRED